MASVPFIREVSRILLNGAAFALVLVTGCALPEVRTAEQLAAQGNWDGAVVAYRAALKKDPFDQSIQEHLKQAQRRAAEYHSARGREFLKDNQLPEALQEFKLALSLDPTRSEHHVGFGDALRLKEARAALRGADTLRNLGRLEEAIEAYERAVELDPDLTPALEAITTISARIKSDEAIGRSTQPITLRFQNARLKEVFEILARAVGINVIFDKDLRDDSVTVFIKDTPFHEALNLILTTHNLFATRVGPDTLLISPYTKQKKAQYQDLMIRTFYISHVKAKDMVNLLRTMLESKRVYVNEKLNAVVIRAEPAKLHLAERIIMANDRRDSEVELDVEVLEVSRTRDKGTRDQPFGLDFAKSAAVGVFPPGFAAAGALSTVPTGFTFEELKNLGDSTVLFTLPSTLLLSFLTTQSDVKTLAAPKIRVVNNGKASINIGDKEPILLSTTNVLPGQAATGAVPTTSTVTSIEFKDTGIKLTVEPTIHLMDELTLKLKIEVTRIGESVTLQTDPLISQFRFGTRTAETTLNMKDEETVVLAGLIQDENRKTRVSVPWLGDIPWLGDLLSTTTETTITTEIVLTITPHIIRNVTPPSVATQAFWSGTATNFATKPLFSGVTRRTSPTPLESAPAPALPQAVPPSPAEGRIPVQPSESGAPAAPAPLPAPETLEAPRPFEESKAPEIVARGAAVLAFRPATLSALTGQEFPMNLMAENLTGLTEAVVVVSYNPTVLEFRRALVGEFLKSGGAPASVMIATHPGKGQVELRMRRDGPPVSGSGVLASLFFRAKAPGLATVELQRPTVTGPDATPRPVTVRRGQVRVR